MFSKPQPPRIHLPKGWQVSVESAVLYAVALAHYAIVYARAWAADSIDARVRLAAENARLHDAYALQRDEIHTKVTRRAQIALQRRLHYGPQPLRQISKNSVEQKTIQTVKPRHTVWLQCAASY